MVATPGQENQMMMNGANFIKNIMSGLTILTLDEGRLAKTCLAHRSDDGLFGSAGFQ